MWVTNADGNTISVFNEDGTSAGSPLTGNGLNIPLEPVVVGSQVWVVNGGSNTISVFNLDGSPAGRQINNSCFNYPNGVLVVGSEVWVTNGESGYNYVCRLNFQGTTTGSPLQGNGLNAAHMIKYNIPPSIYTISGNVFVDRNKNGILDVGEANYASTPTIVASRGTVTTNSDGSYLISNLSAGPVTVSYLSLPLGYNLTYPLSIPPPSFQVTVGPGCTTNNAKGASCQ